MKNKSYIGGSLVIVGSVVQFAAHFAWEGWRWDGTQMLFRFGWTILIMGLSLFLIGVADSIQKPTTWKTKSFIGGCLIILGGLTPMIAPPVVEYLVNLQDYEFGAGAKIVSWERLGQRLGYMLIISGTGLLGIGIAHRIEKLKESTEAQR